VPATLPVFARGLKLIRFAVYVMLLQLVLAIVMTIKAIAASSLDDLRSLLEWTQYFLLANIGAMLAMLIGAARTIPEFARSRMDIRGLVVATAGFAVAAGALGWNYHALSSFVEVVLDPEGSHDELAAAADRLDMMTWFTILKDLAYAVALIAVARTIQRSAALNDQLGLRDEAGSMGRALVVMLVADLFYQVTYGLGPGLGLLGLLASVLVAGYWIYCHLRLGRFLFNAAYFVNEPHNLPLATVVLRDDRPAAPAARPSRPSVPARASQPARPAQSAQPSQPPAIVRPPPPPPAPRAESAGDEAPDAGPRFLR
jgi:hypothetical protein